MQDSKPELILGLGPGPHPLSLSQSPSAHPPQILTFSPPGSPRLGPGTNQYSDTLPTGNVMGIRAVGDSREIEVARETGRTEGTGGTERNGSGGDTAIGRACSDSLFFDSLPKISSNDSNTEDDKETVSALSSSFPRSQPSSPGTQSARSRVRSISVPPLSAALRLEEPHLPNIGYGLLFPASSSNSRDSPSPREEKSADGASSDSHRGRPGSGGIPKASLGSLHTYASDPNIVLNRDKDITDNSTSGSTSTSKSRHKFSVKPNADAKGSKRDSKNRNKHKSDTHKRSVKRSRASDSNDYSGDDNTSGTSSITDNTDNSDSGSTGIIPTSTGEGGKTDTGKRSILQRGQKLVRSKSRSTSPSHNIFPIKKSHVTSKSDTTAVASPGKANASPVVSGYDSDSAITSSFRASKSHPGSPFKPASASPSGQRKTYIPNDIPELTNAPLREILYFYVHNPQDKFALRRFIFAHAHFFTSQELLRELDEIYKEIQPSDKDGKLSFRLINILKSWLDVSYSSMNSELRLGIHEFISYISKCNPNLGDHLFACIERLRNKANMLAQVCEQDDRPSPATPSKSKKNSKSSWKITEFKELEIARQLCLIEHDYMMDITESNLHNLNWTNQPHSKVLEYALFSNKLVAWLVQQVLEEETPKIRAKVVSHILKVSEYLFQLQNFNSMLAIFLALASPILVSDQLWKYVSKKMMVIKDSVLSIVSPLNNFKGYRSHVKNLDPPMIPCLECMLKDIIFLVEGSDDFLDEEKKIINVNKLERLGFYIQFIFQCKEQPYKFHIEPTIFATITYGIKHVEIVVEDDSSSSSRNRTPDTTNNKLADSVEHTNALGDSNATYLNNDTPNPYSNTNSENSMTEGNEYSIEGDDSKTIDETDSEEANDTDTIDSTTPTQTSGASIAQPTM